MRAHLLGAAAALALWPTAARAPEDPAAILGAAPICGAHTPPAPDAPPTRAPGLFAGLGDTGFAVERVRGGPGGEAAAYFDQGLRLANTFSPEEAGRAIRWARRLDPKCAMCAWAEAWAGGPTINYPIDGKDLAEARAAAEDAGRLAAGLSPKAQGLIAATLARYPLKSGRPSVDDGAYAAAMEALARRFPGDDGIVVEAANALMIASRHNWKAASDSASGPGRAQALLDRVIARSPDFEPALHFEIHLAEGAGAPERAEAAADRLERLAPTGGHLLHMPSHIYYRLGRYEDAALANARASAADARYAAALHPPGGLDELALHGHNVSFGLAGALMSGDGPAALAFARQALTFPAGSTVHARAYFALARYAPPAEVLALPRPADPADQALWRYARGEARARGGDAAGVQAEADALKALRASPAFAKAQGSAKTFADIAASALAGRAAMLRGRWPEAIAALSRAADARDKDTGDYADPPTWGLPPRRTLAAARLLGGDAAGAEREAHAALKAEPNDPLALHVLAQAQARLGDKAAPKTEAAARRAWRGPAEELKLELV